LFSMISIGPKGWRRPGIISVIIHRWHYRSTFSLWELFFLRKNWQSNILLSGF